MKNTKNIKEYEAYLFRKELSGGTQKIYVRQAALLMEFLNNRPIIKEELITYKKYLANSGIAVSTQNLYITALNCYLKYGGHGDCMIKTKQIQRRRSLENVISVEEYNCLLDYALSSGRNKYYCIMKTLALTGIRISELNYFTVESLENELIMVENKGKIREIYLPEELIALLICYCRKTGIQSGIIFRGNTGKAISRIAVYKMLVHMADMAGIVKKKVYPHSFRHLFSLTYMAHYGNLAELSDILGHSSIETTRIYTASSVQEKRKRMGDLGL